MEKDVTTGLVDRTTWAAGPWDGEPDRVEWRYHGLVCLALRHPEMGSWCGYVGVPPGNPWRNMIKRRRTAVGELRAHGTVNYTEFGCSGSVCHTPKDGETDDLLWIGFDCGHTFDAQPGRDAFDRLIGLDRGPVKIRTAKPDGLGRVYRSMDYVVKRVEELADQLKDLP